MGGESHITKNQCNHPLSLQVSPGASRNGGYAVKSLSVLRPNDNKTLSKDRRAFKMDPVNKRPNFDEKYPKRQASKPVSTGLEN
jgi:hypothetical protein